MVMDRVRRSATLIVGMALVAACSGATPVSSSTGSPTPSSASSPVASTAPSVAATASPAESPASSVEATPGISGDPQAPDSHVTVKLAAIETHWSTTELTAPAGKVWHLEFDNQSTTLHNFALSSGSQQIFRTETFGHGIQTIDIPGLPADTYLFTCTIHPQTMRGGVVLK
jgi:plastocyanin